MHLGTILIADSNKVSRRNIRKALPDKYFIIIEAANCARANDIVRNHPIDVILMSTTLADINNTSFIRDIRSQKKCSIIMIGSSKEGIKFLEQGADDYISSPINTDEILARVNAALRRTQKDKLQQHANVLCPTKAQKLSFGPWHINRLEYIIHDKNNVVCPLTLQEYNLLNLLICAHNKPLSRDEICLEMKKYNAYLTPRAVDIKISRIRKKIDNKGKGQKSLIQTIRGVGYRLAAPVEIIT